MNKEGKKLNQKAKRDMLELFNKKVFKKNKFRFYKEIDHDCWLPVYINLDKYVDSVYIYDTLFSHIYRDLLSECCDNLKMPYLFSFIPSFEDNDHSMFIKESSLKIKNKNDIIRKSSYLINLVRTFEDNGYDIYCSNSSHALFAYDDIDVIEIVRNVLISFIIRGSDTYESKTLEIFKKNTKNILKLEKANQKKSLIIKQVSIEKNRTETKNESPEEDLLTR